MASTNGPVEIGLIGLGSWAKKAYVPILLEQQDAKVRAVAARTEATRSVARDLFGPDVELYHGYADLLDRSQVGAVMMCLQPSLTTQVIAAALRAEVHIWYEPPLIDGTDTDRVLELAADRNTMVHADLELRYLPVVSVLRDLASSGRLGQLRRVRVEHEVFSEKPHDSSVVFSHGPWYIDLVDVFLEREPERVELSDNYGGDRSIVDAGMATIQYSDDVVGEWAFNFRDGKKFALRVRIEGTEGEAEADLDNGTYRYRSSNSEWQSGTADCSRPMHGFVGMRESIGAFLSAVRGERDTLTGPRLYRRLQRIHAALCRNELEKAS